MQTLGLDPGPAARRDSVIKNLFWPTVESSGDVASTTTQGFWLCVVVAALTFLAFATSGYLWLGLSAAVFFLLGGVGIRQKSRFAAGMIFGVYVVATFADWRFMLVRGGPLALLSPGLFVKLLILALLAANLRAVLLAAKLAEGRLPEGQAGSESREWLTERLPPRLWPVGRYLFLLLGVLWAALVVLAAMRPLGPRG